MYRLSGTHSCRNCGKEYSWRYKGNEAGDGFVIGAGKVGMENVCDIEPISTNLYSVRLRCPKCGITSETVEAKPER